jgi:hypothetical protein
MRAHIVIKTYLLTLFITLPNGGAESLVADYGLSKQDCEQSAQYINQRNELILATCEADYGQYDSNNEEEATPK